MHIVFRRYWQIHVLLKDLSKRHHALLHIYCYRNCILCDRHHTDQLGNHLGVQSAIPLSTLERRIECNPGVGCIYNKDES